MKNNSFNYGSVLKVTRYDTMEDIERNFSLMHDCGMDTVVIWPASFWWEEKKEGYPFNTGKEILKIAEKYDIKVIMELAGQHTSFEYMPDFMLKKEYHPVDQYGHREIGQDSFGFMNYFHPEVNEIICQHYKNAAAAYKEYPALIGYDVFNETMFRSFDKYTMEEFRTWLKEKYGTIEKLNEVWDRTYSQWSQIEYEEWKWMSIMPVADFGAFKNASIGRFMRNWCDAIRSVDTEHFLIADNIHATATPMGDYERPQDDFDLKNVVDEIGMSFYPKQMRSTTETQLRHEVFDAFYAASKREGFFISEMQTHVQALHNPTTCVRPYELKRWCMEAYAAGIKGLIYWMWRPFDKGLQTMGRGLVDHRDRPTERYDAAKEMSHTFEKYGTLTPVRGKVAVLYDSVCEDLHRVVTKTYGLDRTIYNSSLYGAYKALFDNNVKCDVITLGEVNEYKAVILSNQLVMDEARSKVLTEYVRNGGVLIVDGRFGVTDAESRVNKDLPGGLMNKLCGTDFYDLDYEGLDFDYDGIRVDGYYSRDLVYHTDGQCLASFDDGKCAVNSVKYGKGEVITIGTYLWYGYAKEPKESVCRFARKLVDRYDLAFVEAEGDVSVKVSQNDDNYLIFVFNYTEKDQQASVKVNIDGKQYKESHVVEANGVAIVEKAK